MGKNALWFLTLSFVGHAVSPRDKALCGSK